MSRVHIKLRSIPKIKSSSAVYIQLHQLANQRDRLQAELYRIGDRTDEIHQQLQKIELELNQLEAEAADYNKNKVLPISPTNSSLHGQPTVVQTKAAQTHKYQSFVVEY